MNNKQNTFTKIIIKFIKRNIPIIISIIFWLFISFLLVIFVNKLFQSSEEKIIQREKVFIFFLFIISLLLFIIIFLYILKLLISVLKKEFGAKIQLKLTLFFLLVTLLPTIPFIQIGSKFIASSMNIWFSENMGLALDLSEEIIRTYYKEKKNYLLNSVDNLSNIINNKKTILSNLENTLRIFYKKNNFENISIWNANGKIVKQIGKEIFQIKFANDDFLINKEHFFIKRNSEEIFTKEINNMVILIIPAKIFYSKTKKLVCFVNIAIQISPIFNKVTFEIDKALRSYNSVAVYKIFFTRGFVVLFIGVIFPIIVIVLIISLFLTREFLDPISDLARATKRVADGDFNFQIESSFTDEFEILSQSFNAMIGELEFSRKKLKQGEKISTWAEIARRLAHELKNPLTPIQLSSERILKKYKDNSPDFEKVLKKGVSTIINEVENMNRLLIRFSNFAALPKMSKEKGGIIEIIKESIDLFSLNMYNIDLKLSSQKEDFIIYRDPYQLKSVFNNIFKNAIEATKRKDIINIELYERTIGFNDYVIITIEDHGEGIELKKDETIFEPYVSTKSYGDGLGLSIAQRIIHEHEGQIRYVSKKNVGTTFYIELPLSK